MSVDRPREKVDITPLLNKRQAEHRRKYPVQVLVELTEEQGRWLAKYKHEGGRHHSMSAELRQWVDGQMRLEESLSKPMTDEEEIECFGKPLDEHLDDCKKEWNDLEEKVKDDLDKGAKHKKENPFERLLGSATNKMTTDEIMTLTRGEE